MKANVNEIEIKKAIENTEISIISEPVGDIALLIGQMILMELPEILDKYIPVRWNQRSLSWGWTAVVWLAYILSEGDHRKISMEAYARSMKNSLSSLTNQPIEPLDFSDDRLSHLLSHLQKRELWHSVESDVNNRCIEFYELPVETIRCDATTVSGQHAVTDEGLMQFGHSKDDPNRPQLKLMTASLDPMGMPLATDIVSGEKADDKLYIPIIDRTLNSLNKTGLLIVGDCKLSSFEIRSHIVLKEQMYLTPLALTGNTATLMEEWITEGINKQSELEQIFRENERGENLLIARGYEVERELLIVNEEISLATKERVLIIHSPNHAEQQIRGLEQRLKTAQQKIEALTPAKGKGKRQIIEEENLTLAIKKILQTHQVEDFLQVEYEKQVEQQIKYVGKGRGSENRQTQIIEKVRYQITKVNRCEDKIIEQKQRFGWKCFVTNATKERLPLKDAVLCYRNEYRIERIFNRLKSHLVIAPLFLKREDQIEGMGFLLMLGVRVLTLIEFVIRRSLHKDKASLPDLHPENRKKKQLNRLLKGY